MKIGFCGTMSVGKTTLVNALKELPEFEGYSFATERSKYLRDLGIPLNTDSTLKGQTIFLAERCAELINENLITDRTVIDVMAFTKVAKSISYYEAEAFCTLASKIISEYDYIFYVSPEGVEMESNLVRETNLEYRETIDFIIQHQLDSNKHRIRNLIKLPPYLSVEERVKFVKNSLWG